MANVSTIAGSTLIVGLLAGFLVGRAFQNDPAPLGPGTAETAEELEMLRQRLAESEQAREELQRRLAADPMRAPLRGPMSGGMENPMSRGMSGSGGMMPPETPALAENPRPLLEVLAAIHASVSEADWEALVALQPEVAARGGALVSELVSLLANAESLAAMETLAQMLGATGDPAALPALHELLRREDNSNVRTAVIRALGAIPDASSVELLAAEFVRASGSAMPPSVAATSLGAIGTAEALAALQKELREGSNPMVRSFGLNALADKRDPALAGFLMTQASRTDASSDYRAAAIRALAQTGNRDYISQLEGIAFSPDSSRGMQEAAKQAINQLLGRQLYPIR